MEEYMDMIEFQQMKEQIAILNRKLDEKVVVNEKLLRKVVKNKMSGVNRYVGIINSLSLLLIPFMIWGCHYLGLSWWFCGLSCLFLLAAISYTYLTHRQLHTNDLMNDDLVLVARKLVEMKSRYFIWAKLSIPFVIVYLCWFFIEMHLAGKGSMVSLGIACVFALWAAYRQYRSIQCRLDDIHQELDELIKE